MQKTEHLSYIIEAHQYHLFTHRMKGSRTKDSDKARVIEEKVNNPDMKLRELQDMT